jgi:hypothetical protein
MTGKHIEMCPRTGFKPAVAAVTELYAFYDLAGTDFTSSN